MLRILLEDVFHMLVDFVMDLLHTNFIIVIEERCP